MKLRRQQKHWDHLARLDPLWAVLTTPQKMDGCWDPKEFFDTGGQEVAAAMQAMETLGYPAARESALDFGCGVGRISQALCGHFDRVVGVDISASMVELARQHDRAGGRCTYVVNSEDNLQAFPSNTFDLVYSRFVLQHLPPRHARHYLREFIRVLKPSGLAIFQLPSRFVPGSLRERLAFHTNLWLRSRVFGDPRIMEMYSVPVETVVREVKDCGGRIVNLKEDRSAGGPWESYVYSATK
jgi:SAM-dependent methyltransferase